MVHVPLIEKQPPVRLIPFAAVDDALVDVRFITGVARPVYIVEVEFATEFAELLMERREPGVVVPMPTLPAFVIVNAAGDDVA